MKLVPTEFKSGGLHEKHVVAYNIYINIQCSVSQTQKTLLCLLLY